MFPKAGTTVPKTRSRSDAVDAYAKGVGAALRRELGDSRHATKTVMRWTDASERSIKNWLGAKKGPRGDNLIDLIRNSDEVLRELLRLAGRPEIETLGELAGLREILSNATDRIDAAILRAVAEEDRTRLAELATGPSTGTPANEGDLRARGADERMTVYEFDTSRLNTRDKVVRAFGAAGPRTH